MCAVELKKGDVYVDFAKRCVERLGAGGDEFVLQKLVAVCARSFAVDTLGCGSDGFVGGCRETERLFEELRLRCCSGSALELGSAGDGDGTVVEERVCEARAVEPDEGSGDTTVGNGRGKHFEKNRRKRVAAKLARLSVKRKGYDSDGSAGSVRTVDTRTGVEIEAAQTLAARRVAENKRAEVEAKVAAALAEHRLKALSDKGRTAVVERLAAARYEQRINEARLRAQKSFSASEDSLKSLGSMGSAGELYAKQAIKKSRDDAKTLKYVQDQARLLLEYASPEVRQMVAEMPAPVYDDEFEVFGDCPSDFDDEQREAYYADLNRANFELGQVRVESEGHREATPEELLRIKEELAALSVY